MKLKRLAALALTLALTLSLAAVPAHALVFTDVDEDFWGYGDITKMSNLGYAKGYDDGSFKPNGRMTAAETLLFCARATGVDSATQAKIAEDRKEQMTETLPTSNNMNVWAAAEMAVAVEAGVLSLSELEELSQEDPRSEKTNEKGEKEYKTFLEETMSRENICMYLVRAMQLEPLARSLSNYSLSYADRSDISPALQPYVFVLTQYGIVQGKDGGLFDPKGAVTRAEMTTMLSRALSFMTEAGIVTELSEYTDYDWRSGVISTVTNAADGAIILSLQSEISGPQSYSIPSTAKIYHDNMLTSSTALKAGQQARLILGAGGVVQAVRLSGAASTYSGTISDLTDNQLTILINGVAHTLTIDRFTEVSVGKTAGDRSIIDEEAGYTSASCTVDEMGHLASVRFSGGTQLTSGLVESVTTIGSTTTLGVTAFNGVVYHYSVPQGTTVTVNGVLGSLSSAHAGKYVQLRLVTDSNQVASVAVDTMSTFVQGPVRRLGSVGTARSVTLYDNLSGKEVTPTVSLSAAITYDGQPRTITQIEQGWYVTAMLVSNQIVQMDAFPGSTTVEGVLSSINYGNPTTTIQVTLEDDSVANYNLDITNPPTVTRSGKASALTELVTGDLVSVIIRYNEVEKIEATPQTADLTGVIEEISMTSTGVTMKVKLTGGETATYTVSDGISVTQSGKASNIYELKPGFSIAMVTDGDRVVSVDVTAVASSSTELTGSVLLVTNTGGNTANGVKTITLQVVDAMGKTNLVVMDVKNAKLLDLTGNELILGKDFTAGDVLRAFGSYDGATFVATIVIKQ